VEQEWAQNLFRWVDLWGVTTGKGHMVRMGRLSCYAYVQRTPKIKYMPLIPQCNESYFNYRDKNAQSTNCTGDQEDDKTNKFWEELIRLLSLHKSFIWSFEPNLMERNLSELILTSLNSIWLNLNESAVTESIFTSF
jgi:hypothetical protein